MTQLTIEALSLLNKLLQNEYISSLDTKEREELIIKSLNEYLNQTNQKRISVKIKHHGLIKNTIINYLVSNPNQKFSTVTLSKELDIPLSTVRLNIREISKTNTNFEIIQGRPNYIYYKPKT